MVSVGRHGTLVVWSPVLLLILQSKINRRHVHHHHLEDQLTKGTGDPRLDSHGMGSFPMLTQMVCEHDWQTLYLLAD